MNSVIFWLRQLSTKLVGFPRGSKLVLMVASDLALLGVAGYLAFWVRMGEAFEPSHRQWLLIAAAPIIAIPVFFQVGLYRSVIRFLGEQALWVILKGMSIAAVFWASLAFLTQMTGIDGLPRTIPLLYWLMGTFFVAGSRFSARWVLWEPIRRRFAGRQVLIYGGGVAGRQVAASLRRGRDLFPAGYLDDDIALHGKDIGGLRVYRPADLPELIKSFDIRDVIVTLPNASAARRREVVGFLEQYPVRVRILPEFTDIASGKHLVSMVREVDIGDLLGRDAVAADTALLGQCITGKVVLVTGAGGSIGSEICRQVSALNPRRLVLLDVSEGALYEVDRALRSIASCELVACLGSVRDADLLARLIRTHQIQTVYHAAAHKHVPLVEHNVLEGVRNNVIGTATVVRAAFLGKVETFVLISTDKAVRPANVMGATKRWAELIVQDFARRARDAGTRQCFCAVRFGNVLGSSGSVIPLFKEQIAQGGPVTVTHAEVTRYFMSIHEAVQLVIQAGSLGQGGEIFLLDMGEPVRIMDLARNMVRLAGHSVRDTNNPDGDIEIVVTGLRPGEKLYEELLVSRSQVEDTAHPKIRRVSEPVDRIRNVEERLDALNGYLDLHDEASVRDTLMELAGALTVTPLRVVPLRKAAL